MNNRNAAAELAVETLPVEQLVPYARNSRTHSPEQIAQVAASTGKRAVLESTGEPFPATD